MEILKKYFELHLFDAILLFINKLSKTFPYLFFKGIFVTRVQPDGPASKLLQPGDKIIQVMYLM